MLSKDIGVWIGAILTIFVYTYFISSKQNILFRFAQSTVIGGGLGYIIVLVMAKNIDSLAISKIAKGNWLYIIPIILGLMVYARFHPRYRYLARTPISIIISVGLGLGSRAALETEIFRQISASFKLAIFGVDQVTAINNLIYIIGLITVLFYFYFTLSPKISGTMKPLSTLGRYYLMIYFGARFGTTVMSRLTLFMGRLQFLLYEWLGF